jgi:hypothetical protein
VTIVTSLLLHWQGPGTVLTIRSPADIDAGKLRHLGVDRQALLKWAMRQNSLDYAAFTTISSLSFLCKVV